MTRNVTEPADGVSRRTLEILREVTGERDVLTDPDLPLYTSGLLDSLGTVTLTADSSSVTVASESDRCATA